MQSSNNFQCFLHSSESLETQKVIKYPSTVDFENFYSTICHWMELQAFEMQILELQFRSIWKQTFVDLRVRLEIIEHDRCSGLEPQLSAENEDTCPKLSTL